jgi:DNA polymerase-1
MFNFPCPSSYECVTTEKALARWVSKIESVKAFSFDTEGSGLDNMTAELRGLSLGVLNKNHDPEGCYIPLTHHTEQPQLKRKTVFSALRPALANPKKRVVFHNAPFDLVMLHRHGLEFPVNVHDTQLASYALTTWKDMGGHGMDYLCKKYFDYDTIRFQDVVLGELGHEEFGDVGLEEATAYAGEDSAVTIAMFDHFARELKNEGLWGLYQEDRKLAPVIARMKLDGVALDAKKVYGVAQEWIAEQGKLYRKIVKVAGKELNLGSPKKLAEYLFDELKLPSPKETDSGGRSTDAETLELLKNDHKIIPLIISHNKYSTLISNYGASLIDKVNPETKLIHPNFNLTSTKTGRLSGSDPNTQKMPDPDKSPEGSEIKAAFIPRAKNRLVGSFDYSQIEVRILAHITGDETLIGAFERGEDAHATTAAMMWGKDPSYYLDKNNSDGVMKRKRAKSVTFGIIYGITEFGLSRQLRVDPTEALEFMELYAERMPSVEEYKQDTIEFAKKHKYAETLFGRRIHVPQINWGGGVARGQERQAINAPIQGSSADITRRAMVRVAEGIHREDLDCLMTLSVHDELVFDCLDEHTKKAKELITEIMITCADDVVQWKVPIEVDGKFGSSWKDAH